MPSRIALAIVPAVIDTLMKRQVQLNPQEMRHVAYEVEERVKPVVDHETNNEPWYRSRVTLGSFASVLTGISTVLMMFSTGDFDPQQVTLAVGAIGGGLAALWGRWAAKKPLGR